MTVTSNSVMFAGYHSGIAAIVCDNENHVIWTSPLFSVGVNPQGFSGRAQVSTNAWRYQVPVNIADQAGSIQIGLTDSPDNLKAILDHSVGALINDLVPAIAAIGGLLSGSKESGGAQAQAITTSAAALATGWQHVDQPEAALVEA